jgi:hypothetical protein
LTGADCRVWLTGITGSRRLTCIGGRIWLTGVVRTGSMLAGNFWMFVR